MGRPAKDFTQNGFTLFRIIAASLVIITHTYVVLGHNEGDILERHHYIGLSNLGLGAFFIMSGYLVTLSMLRNGNLVQFALNRAIRILPGLTAVVLLSAFVIGPLLTTSPHYFSNPVTWSYLRNILVFNQEQRLPGVFESNPVPVVNGSLWSLPIETLCYGALIVLAWASSIRARPLALLFLMMLALHLNDTFFRDKYVFGVAQLSLNEFGLQFVYGAMLAALGDRLRPSWIVSLLSVCAIVYGYIHYVGDWKASSAIYLMLWPYTVVTTALLLKKMAFLNRFDISYGTYIYGFLIQQILVMVMPHRHLYLFMVVSLLLSYAAGAASWFLVEKPAMRLKKVLSKHTKKAELQLATGTA